ncbi:lipopolysaccharide heptosyltransferase II [bacterium]|nr:lipopolysaccharide heptosyltransferase II [bacterium]
MKRSISLTRRILVIRLSSLGDVVLTTLLLRRLRKRFPEARIDMLTGEQYLPLIEENSHLDERYELPKNLWSRRRQANNLAKVGYDTVIDLQNSLTSRLILSAIAPQQVYRYRRSRLNRWLRIHFPSLRKKLTTPPPVALGYLHAAEPLLVTDDDLGLELNVNPQSSKAVSEMINEFLNENISVAETEPLILAPGARHYTKMWQAESWAAFMREAYNEGFQFQVLIGSAEDVDIAKKIQSQVDFPLLMAAGRTSLSELVALIARGRALVTNDSGPMHIASAVSVPIVAIFGSTVPEFGFAPFRALSEVVQISDDLSCRPCHPHGRKSCPRKHFRCMSEIEPGSVMAALDSICEKE